MTLPQYVTRSTMACSGVVAWWVAGGLSSRAGSYLADRSFPIEQTAGAMPTWSSGLCDCTDDWCSCLSVWCCPSVTTAQLCTRLLPRQPTRIMWCVLVLIFFSGTMHIVPLLLVARNAHDAGYEFLYEALYEVLDDELQKSHGSPFPGPLAQLVFILLILLGSLFTCLAVYQVRMAIRKRDSIPGSNCEDCCYAWCCNPCTQCLIFRHEGRLVAGKYSLCSPTGTHLRDEAPSVHPVDPAPHPVMLGMPLAAQVCCTGIGGSGSNTASTAAAATDATATDAAPMGLPVGMGAASAPHDEIAAKLVVLKKLQTDGTIRSGEFETKKAELLSRM